MELITPEELVGEEWAAWYRMTPAQRWAAQDEMWALFLALGGTFDPEPDTQSPFFDEAEWRESLADGGAGVRVIRRGGV